MANVSSAAQIEFNFLSLVNLYLHLSTIVLTEMYSARANPKSETEVRCPKKNEQLVTPPPSPTPPPALSHHPVPPVAPTAASDVGARGSGAAEAVADLCLTVRGKQVISPDNEILQSARMRRRSHSCCLHKQYNWPVPQKKKKKSINGFILFYYLPGDKQINRWLWRNDVE